MPGLSRVYMDNDEAYLKQLILYILLLKAGADTGFPKGGGGGGSG